VDIIYLKNNVDKKSPWENLGAKIKKINRA